MRRLPLLALAVLAVLAPASAAAQQPSGDPTLYCQGDGGPLGIASDAEHTVALGEAPLPPGLRASRISVNGVETRVIEAGPAAADTAVVFVHGHPGSARDFDDLQAASGGFARAVSFDVSGYGQSDKAAAQAQSTDGAAAYVQGVLDRLGIRHVVLVLHDFGGIWGLQWAAQHPDALDAAVLIDTGVLIDYVPHPFAVIWSTPIAGELQMASTTRQSFVASIQSSGPRPLPDEFVQRMYDNYDRAERCAALRYYRSAAQNLNIGRQQAAALSKRRRPALVIWGKGDLFVPADQAEKQKQAFPDARIEIFEDSGHWPFIDDAERARGLIVPFLRPTMTASRPRRSGRRVRVPVRVEGVLPASEVRATLARRGRTLARSAPIQLSGARTLSLRPARALRPGRYRVRVSAYGLPTRTRSLRIRAARVQAPGETPPAAPRFTG
jgi:pimeloyl-ACP methyl ester carboxylesterase